MTTNSIGTPYNRFHPRESFDAIVIGSGSAMPDVYDRVLIGGQRFDYVRSAA